MQQKSDLVGLVVASCVRVRDVLGPGLLECPYRNALLQELLSRGCCVGREGPYTVWYNDVVVGNYRADLVVNDRLIVEVKAVDVLTPGMVAQVINYLHIARIREGLLVNFGGTAGLKWRYVYKPDVPV